MKMVANESKQYSKTCWLTCNQALHSLPTLQIWHVSVSNVFNVL